MTKLFNSEAIKLAKAEKKGTIKNSDLLNISKVPFHLITKFGIIEVKPFVSSELIKGKFTNTIKFRYGQTQFASLSGLVSYFGLK